MISREEAVSELLRPENASLCVSILRFQRESKLLSNRQRMIVGRRSQRSTPGGP